MKKSKKLIFILTLLTLSINNVLAAEPVWVDHGDAFYNGGSYALKDKFIDINGGE